MVWGMETFNIDFMKKWYIEVNNTQTQWRVGQILLQDGDWHQFSNVMTSSVDIYAECAGMSELTEGEEHELKRRVDEILER